MLKRLLAVVFAVLVLLFAIGVRTGREDGSGDGGSRSRSSDPYEVFDDRGVRMLCIEELRPVCQSTFDLLGFVVTIEPAWKTVDRLRDGGALGADVWLTVRPFDVLARPITRPAEPALGASTDVVARSPIVLLGPTPALAAVDQSCPEAAVRFTCALSTGRPGAVTLRNPSTSAFGVLALATVAYELGTPADASTLDPAIAGQVDAILRAARTSQAPLQDAERLGGQATALTVEAEFVEVVADVPYDERPATAALTSVRYPIDVRPVEVVAVASGTFRSRDDLDFVLSSDTVTFAFGRIGFVAEADPGYLVDGPPFEERPLVRTDLGFRPELVAELRRLAAR